MATPRKQDLRGIESREDAQGRVSYRPYVTDPDDRNRKIRGEWTHNFPEAKGWRVRALAKLADGIDLKPAPTLATVQEAAEVFLAGAKAGTILSPRNRRPYAPRTVRDYEQAFRDWINPELGSVPIDKLRRSQVQRLVDTVAAVRAGGTTRNAVHALCALYTHLLPRHDEIGHDPTQGLILPAPAGIRDRYADPARMEELLGALAHDLDLLTPFALAFLAGLRKGEIRCLPLDRIDLEAGWIDVSYSLDPKEGFKGPKSYAGQRPVPIFDGLRPILERVMARATMLEPSTDERPGTLLLPSRRSDSLFGTRQIGSPYIRLCRRAWAQAQLEPIGLHEARHSYATNLIRAGYDVKIVSEWIGHADPATTLRIYVKGEGRGNSAELTARGNRYLAALAP